MLADLDGDNRNELIVGDLRRHRARDAAATAASCPAGRCAATALPLHTGGAAFASGAVSPDTSRRRVPGLAPRSATSTATACPRWSAADIRGPASTSGARTARAAGRAEAEPRLVGPAARAVRRARATASATAPSAASSARRCSPTSTATSKLEVDRRRRWTATCTRGTRDGYAGAAASRSIVVDRSKVASIDPATHAVDVQRREAGRLADAGRDRRHARGRRHHRRREARDRRRDERGVQAPTRRPTREASNADNVERSPRDQLRSAAGRRPGSCSTRELAAVHDRRRAGVLDGWPAKIGISSTAELLPVVGEGITGSPGDRSG